MKALIIISSLIRWWLKDTLWSKVQSQNILECKPPTHTLLFFEKKKTRAKHVKILELEFQKKHKTRPRPSRTRWSTKPIQTQCVFVSSSVLICFDDNFVITKNIKYQCGIVQIYWHTLLLIDESIISLMPDRQFHSAGWMKFSSHIFSSWQILFTVCLRVSCDAGGGDDSWREGSSPN